MTEIVSPPASQFTRSRNYYLLLTAVTVFLLLPVLSVHFVPLVDYPNHLARIYILDGYQHAAAYQQNYLLHLRPVPNLAMDLVLTPFAGFLSPVVAAKCFLVFTILLFVWGVHELAKAIHGQRWSWLAILCFFFVYNSEFLYGYVNYVFGLGIFCLALSYWLRWRKSLTVFRLLILSLLACAAYISHLTSFGFLGICMVVTVAYDVFSAREEWITAALSLLPLVPSAGIAFFYGGGEEANGVTDWLLRPKLLGPATLLATYNHGLDWVLFAGVLLLLWMLVFRTERSLERPIFVAGLVLFLLFLVLPSDYLGTAYVDTRMLPAAMLLCVLSLKVKVNKPVTTAIFIGVLLISAVRIYDIWATWRHLDRRIAAQVEAFRIFPENAHVLPVFPRGESDIGKRERSLEHIILYSTIYEHTYVPTLFAFWQQPVAFRTPPVKVLSKDTIDGYDFVWSYRPTQTALALLQASCKPLRAEDGFVIWQVQHLRHGAGS